MPAAQARSDRCWWQSDTARCALKLLLIAPATAPGSEKRLLDHVLGIQQRAEHAIAVHVQLAAVCPG